MASDQQENGVNTWDINEKYTTDQYKEVPRIKGKITCVLAITSIAAVLGSSFPHGWNTGVLNAPSQLIKDFLNESLTDRFDQEPSDDFHQFIWALSVSVYLVGGCIGAFSVVWLADAMGRRNSLLFLNLFGIIAAVMFGLCDFASSYEMFIIARIIVGYGCGAGSGLVPMYLTEMAPTNLRGAMGVLHQFGLTCGIFVSQVIGIRQLLGHVDRWPFLLTLTAAPCIVSLVVLPFSPESPRFLFVNKRNDKAAKTALMRLRGRRDVDADLMEMKAEQEQLALEPRWSMLQLLRNRTLRLPLMLVCVLAMCQQLSGINVVFYYSMSVFIAADIPDDYIQYAVISTGLMNVLMTAISVPLMEKWGRRPLLLAGIGMMVVAAVVMTIALQMQEKLKWMSYISIACTILFVIGFSIGLGSIPQFIGGELFKQGPRPPAMSMAGFLNWLCNFLVAIAYPAIEDAMGPFSFLLFTGFLLGFGFIIWWKLPETKNKTHEEIYQHFLKGSKKTVDVQDGLLTDAARETTFNKSSNANAPI